MTICHRVVLATLLAATAWPLRAAESPVVFARSGQKATLPLGGDHGKSGGPVALWAFGQRWGEPLTVKNNAAEVAAPKVRVPVVFRLSPIDDIDVVLGELVVYPDRPAHWDKDVQLVTSGVPDWFDTWCGAVGLPIEKFKELKSLDAGNWRIAEKPGLLILGRKAGGDGPAAIARLAAEHAMNVLVLETDWPDSSGTVSRATVVSAKHMTGALADLQTQNWSLPPAFRQRVAGIANRQTWIAGPGYPLVEEIRSPQRGAESLRTVFSYLPWQQQLGRVEMADELFLRLLAETAKGAKDRPPLDGRWCLLYPRGRDIKADERPVLAAALKSAEADAGSAAPSREIRGYVLDVRGKAPPRADFFAETGPIKTIQARIGVKSPLLILGDNPVLDTWKWLKPDRPEQRSPGMASPRCPPGVLWWPDNSLPASMESQLRLMQLFTEWNVSLGDISREVGNEERKNEP
jgi:hypothetical protein